MSKLTKGPLSQKDKDYIVQNSQSMTPQDIANHLNRSVDSIHRLLEVERNKQTVVQDNETRKQIQQLLRKKPFFKTLKDVFSVNEIANFVVMWTDFMEQFGQDVMASEEQELKKLFEMEILSTRLLKDEKVLIDRRAQYDEMLSYILKLSLGEQDIDEIRRLEAQCEALSEQIDKKKKEFRELVSKQGSIRDKLYKRRSDRTEDLNKAKVDYTAQIKLLQDPAWRREAAMAMEIMALAAINEQERMGEYFEFADGKLDQLLLNADTAEKTNN